ncbi:MAG: hypothetical protein NW241_14105 [Bacteroidia bacterium]|nr:hypothetical protein [Bacteroidia bacterium]
MRMLLLLCCCFTSALCAQEAAAPVLEAAIGYPCFREFMHRDPSGRLRLAGIAAGNRISSYTDVQLDGQPLPVLSGSQDRKARYLLHIKRFRLRAETASLSFTYDRNLRGWMRLRPSGQGWEVHKVFIRQRIQGINGKLGTRFCISL